MEELLVLVGWAVCVWAAVSLLSKLVAKEHPSDAGTTENEADPVAERAGGPKDPDDTLF